MWVIQSSTDDSQFSQALKNHTYSAWRIYYDSQIGLIDQQINQLHKEIQQINSMSLTANSIISPYQNTINSFSASNDFSNIIMAQAMMKITTSASRGIQKNTRAIARVQDKLKNVQNRKRSLIRMNSMVMENKMSWQQHKLTQQLKASQQAAQRAAQQAAQQAQQAHNMPNNGNNNANQVQNLQNQINQLQQTLINVVQHQLANDNNGNGN